MLISHEVPIELLPVSTTFNSYCYCLVHLLPLYPKYREHYFNSVKNGRRVLLDNSIFELGEAYNADEFANWVKELAPYEYIVPDCLEDATQTKNNYLSFFEKHTELPGKVIAVAQGKTYEEIKDLCLFFNNEERVSKIAISFDYSYYLTEECIEYANRFALNTRTEKWWNYCFGRLALIDRLVREKVITTNKRLHLLGCSVPFEFSIYRYLELDQYVDTLDTSNPIVAGILGKRYTQNGLEEKWSSKLVDYIDAELTTTQLKDVWYNVNMFRKLVQG